MSVRAVFLASVLSTVTALGGVASAENETGYVPAEPGDYGTAHGAPISKILFLNRCVGGCRVTAGPNDARYNTAQSTIVKMDGTLTEWEHGDQVWNDMVDCVKEIYAPFDVQITTTDPGEKMFHHEAMVAGLPTDIGYDDNALGVAPISSTCEPYNNVISFTFANAALRNARFICEIVAQESAHAFGLDHLLDCTDPMTYLPSCGPKYFRDATNECGESTARTCFCGGSAQNSHRKLLSVFGPNPTPIPGPELNIELPLADSTVEPNFQVRFTTSDARTVKKAEILFNGTIFTTLDGQGWPETDNYVYSAPSNLADGIIDVEIRSYNDLGVMTSKVVTVTKGAPCTTADQCNEGQLCNSGRCAWPPPTQELGEPCTNNMECISGLCPANGGEQLCSEFCTPTVADQCTEGFDCLPAGAPGQGVCWPSEGGGGGCCSTNRDGVPLGQLALYGALIFLFALRRRQRVR
jgi:hypothetical protein